MIWIMISSDSPDLNAIFRILLFNVTADFDVTAMGFPSLTCTITRAFSGSVPSNHMGEPWYELERI